MTHAGPHVGIDHVRAVDGFQRIVRDADLPQPARRRGDLRLGLVTLGRRHGHVHSQAARRQHQRMRHVVAVADERQLQAFPPAEAFLDGLHVGERLAGMIQVAQGVDHGHMRPLREFVHRVLGEDPRDDALGPAIQVAGDVLDGLALADRADRSDGIAAELLDRQLKGHPGAQRRLFEQQADVAPGECLGETLRRALDLSGEVENAEERVLGQVEVLGQVLCHCLDKPRLCEARCGHGRLHSE